MQGFPGRLANWMPHSNSIWECQDTDLKTLEHELVGLQGSCLGRMKVRLLIDGTHVGSVRNNNVERAVALIG
jgi:hypothetical protein